EQQCMVCRGQECSTYDSFAAAVSGKPPAWAITLKCFSPLLTFMLLNEAPPGLDFIHSNKSRYQTQYEELPPDARFPVLTSLYQSEELRPFGEVADYKKVFVKDKGVNPSKSPFKGACLVRKSPPAKGDHSYPRQDRPFFLAVTVHLLSIHPSTLLKSARRNSPGGMYSNYLPSTTNFCHKSSSTISLGFTRWDKSSLAVSLTICREYQHVSDLEGLINACIFVPIERVGNRLMPGYTPVFGVPIRSDRDTGRSITQIPPNVNIARSDCEHISVSLLGKPLSPKVPKARKPIGYMRDAPNPTAQLRSVGAYTREQLYAQFLSRYESRCGRGMSGNAASATCIDEVKETPTTEATLKAKTIAEHEKSSFGTCTIEPAMLGPTPSDETTIQLPQTSVVESSIPEAVVPLSTGDPKNWLALGICRPATNRLRELTEYTLAIISRRPDKVYEDVCSLQSPALRQGGFQLAPIPLDATQSEQNIFLNAYLDFFKDIAQPCCLTSDSPNNYEVALSPDTPLAPPDCYAIYVNHERKTCMNCRRKIALTATSRKNPHAWAHYLYNRAFSGLNMDDELSVREIFETTKSDHTVKIKRNTSNLILIRCLFVAQLFKLKILPECELEKGAVVTALGVSMPATLASIIPDTVDMVTGPELPIPIMDPQTDDQAMIKPSHDVSFGRSVLSEETLTPQDELLATIRTIEASPADLLYSPSPAKSRAKFRIAVEKILAKKKTYFNDLMSENEKQVESAREALAKRPRDRVLTKVLDDLRDAQVKIDSSLSLIETVVEEIRATAHLDDLPIMTTYRDDLDLDSLPNCPVDLGTAFLAYVSRAMATLGQAEYVQVDKRDRYRNHNTYLPTNKTGSFTRDMKAAIRNFKYDSAFVGATTINEKSEEINHKIRRGPGPLPA
ncbi:hypothetical protein ACOME3_000851, partial [Neoechinorhynchus agilis]